VSTRKKKNARKNAVQARFILGGSFREPKNGKTTLEKTQQKTVKNAVFSKKTLLLFKFKWSKLNFLNDLFSFINLAKINRFKKFS
jgi:hypothetical protein